MMRPHTARVCAVRHVAHAWVRARACVTARARPRARAAAGVTALAGAGAGAGAGAAARAGSRVVRHAARTGAPVASKHDVGLQAVAEEELSTVEEGRPVLLPVEELVEGRGGARLAQQHLARRLAQIAERHADLCWAGTDGSRRVAHARVEDEEVRPVPDGTRVLRRPESVRHYVVHQQGDSLVYKRKAFLGKPQANEPVARVDAGWVGGDKEMPVRRELFGQRVKRCDALATRQP